MLLGQDYFTYTLKKDLPCLQKPVKKRFSNKSCWAKIGYIWVEKTKIRPIQTQIPSLCTNLFSLLICQAFWFIKKCGMKTTYQICNIFKQLKTRSRIFAALQSTNLFIVLCESEILRSLINQQYFLPGKFLKNGNGKSFLRV